MYITGHRGHRILRALRQFRRHRASRGFRSLRPLRRPTRESGHFQVTAYGFLVRYTAHFAEEIDFVAAAASGVAFPTPAPVLLKNGERRMPIGMEWTPRVLVLLNLNAKAFQPDQSRQRQSRPGLDNFVL